MAKKITTEVKKFTTETTAVETMTTAAATSTTTTNSAVGEKTEIDSAMPARLILDVTQPSAVQSWCEQHTTWAEAGNVVQAHYNDVGVVVYQAFNKEIAAWAVKHQRFGGIWSPTRMTWCVCVCVCACVRGVSV